MAFAYPASQSQQQLGLQQQNHHHQSKSQSKGHSQSQSSKSSPPGGSQSKGSRKGWRRGSRAEGAHNTGNSNGEPGENGNVSYANNSSANAAALAGMQDWAERAIYAGQYGRVSTHMPYAGVPVQGWPGGAAGVGDESQGHVVGQHVNEIPEEAVAVGMIDASQGAMWYGQQQMGMGKAAQGGDPSGDQAMGTGAEQPTMVAYGWHGAQPFYGVSQGIPSSLGVSAAMGATTVPAHTMPAHMANYGWPSQDQGESVAMAPAAYTYGATYNAYSERDPNHQYGGTMAVHLGPQGAVQQQWMPAAQWGPAAYIPAGAAAGGNPHAAGAESDGGSRQQ